MSVSELISIKKIYIKIKRKRGINGRTFSQNPRKRGKSHHHHYNSGLRQKGKRQRKIRRQSTSHDPRDSHFSKDYDAEMGSYSSSEQLAKVRAPNDVTVYEVTDNCDTDTTRDNAC